MDGCDVHNGDLHKTGPARLYKMTGLSGMFYIYDLTEINVHDTTDTRRHC